MAAAGTPVDAYRRPQRRVSLARIGLYVAVVIIVVQALAPFVWLIISSISTQAELLTVPPTGFPKRQHSSGTRVF